MSARKSLLRQIKQFKWQRNFSASRKLLDDFVIKSVLPDIVIPNMRLIDRLWKASDGFKDHVALECAETRKSYTYNQLERCMARFATSLLIRLGLKSGDVVAAMLPNCPEFAVVAFGTVQAGCILTTINPIYKEFEISHQMSTTGPKIMVTIPECYDTVIKGLKQAKSKAEIVIIDNPGYPVPEGTIRYSEIAESGDIDRQLLDKVKNRQDDVAFIPFSSGTTGLPKGVEITYRNALAAIEIMQNERICFPVMTHGDVQDIVPCILPFFHIYGLIVALIGHLALGCKLVTLKKFSADLYFDILKTQNVSLLYIVPPIAILLGKHPDVKPEYFRNVRHIVCGAAPLSDSDALAVIERSQKHIEFNQGWGATETTSMGTATFKETTVQDFASSGHPTVSMRIKFVDPQTGNPVPTGQQGEFYIAGPTIMKGYHKNEKATQDSLTSDGYFKTGDLGLYTPDKGLIITDRIKELIKVKGMQVAPAELESILRTHPSVEDAAVIGVPHEFHGESPKAFIIPKSGTTTSPKELQKFVAEKVASFKRIDEVVFVKDIPKTSSGKILRKDLKKMYG